MGDKHSIKTFDKLVRIRIIEIWTEAKKRGKGLLCPS